MSLFKIFVPKEESLLNKALKTENGKIPKNIVKKLKEMEKDLMSSQLLNHEILTRIKSNLTTNEYLRLLCVIFIIIKHDSDNALLMKIVSNSVQFITHIPVNYKTQEEKELMIVFSNHLDLYTSLYVDDSTALDRSITLDKISILHSDKSYDQTINTLTSMFFNFISLDWNNPRFFINKFHLYIINFFIKELTTTFYRLCCYIQAYFDTIINAPPNSLKTSLKILLRFQECQSFFKKTLENPNVRNYFPNAPLFTPVDLETFQELLCARMIKNQETLVELAGIQIPEVIKGADINMLTNNLKVVNENFQRELNEQMMNIIYFTRIIVDSSSVTRDISRSTSKQRNTSTLSEGRDDIQSNSIKEGMDKCIKSVSERRIHCPMASQPSTPVIRNQRISFTLNTNTLPDRYLTSSGEVSVVF
ncbi:hypothetical protein ENUP19_0102G0032 [Entamoeba nuttalli]|uniref:Uncharacterized protein n=2 Tax=Entamoeba nuttalli TaxID=412467 RepID=K2HC20_ENTNP|nr:hypothetical protein ENU1_098020 [Entamoeba nuttalli P19]EKE40219.1 hypothetical protein ENU1_098020 [Entamoeba nuttalli P19]|eukprot:XP_008857450.1 hypothetical protein ENU1_098020 [Entamoeba nuttalli P19]